MPLERVLSALRPEDAPIALAYDPQLDAATGGFSPPLLQVPREVVFEASSYSRSLPRFVGRSTGSEALAAYFRQVNAHRRQLPASVHVNINDLIVRDRVLYVRRDGDLMPLYETVRANDRPYAPLYPDLQAPECVLDEAGQRHLYLGSAGSFNYGHWLVDDLPRLAWINSQPRDVTVVMPSAGSQMDEIRRASITLLFNERTPPMIFLDPQVTYRLTRGAYVTPVSYHPVLKMPEALHYVRSRAVAALPPRLGSPPGRRLFISRAETRGRRLINQQEIAGHLLQAGFESLDPETLTFERQVEAFSRAEMVVGVMGAAMTNTLFCPAGCRVGHLAPEGWIEPFYWDLANVLGHVYFTAFGAVSSTEEPVHMSAFSVGASDLQALLMAMESA